MSWAVNQGAADQVVNVDVRQLLVAGLEAVQEVCNFLAVLGGAD